MSDSIQAAGKFELRDLQKDILWHTLRKLRILLALMGVFFLMGVANLFISHFNSAALWLLIFPIVVVFLVFRGVRTAAKKALQASNRPVEYSFNLMGYEIKTNSSLVKNEWDNLHKVQESETSFLLFPQANFFQVVPKRFFAEEQDIAELREIIRVRLGSKAALKQLN